MGNWALANSPNPILSSGVLLSFAYMRKGPWIFTPHLGSENVFKIEDQNLDQYEVMDRPSFGIVEIGVRYNYLNLFYTDTPIILTIPAE